MALTRTITAALAISGGCVVHAFSTGKIASSSSSSSSRTRIQQTSSSLFSTTENTASASAAGSIHGENSCFLPLLQNDDEYIAPRIVQVRCFHTNISPFLSFSHLMCVCVYVCILLMGGEV